MLDQNPQWLHALPEHFRELSKDERAKVLLRLKAKDAKQYMKLRAQALRCAR